MEVMFAFESAPKSTPMKHVALEVEVQKVFVLLSTARLMLLTVSPKGEPLIGASVFPSEYRFCVYQVIRGGTVKTILLDVAETILARRPQTLTKLLDGFTSTKPEPDIVCLDPPRQLTDKAEPEGFVVMVLVKFQPVRTLKPLTNELTFTLKFPAGRQLVAGVKRYTDTLTEVIVKGYTESVGFPLASKT